MNQDGTALDSRFFRDIQKRKKKKFKVRRTYNPKAIGEYKITYKAYFRNFDWAYTIQEKPFTVFITDGTEPEVAILDEVPEIEIDE